MNEQENQTHTFILIQTQIHILIKYNVFNEFIYI